MISRRRDAYLPAVLYVVVAASSRFVPLSYDEGNWLAVTRRVARGARLYEDITDNKTPALFGLIRGLDVLPGSYPTARALWCGLLAAATALAVRSLARSAGWSPQSATLLGVALGFAIASQSVFVANFEAPAATLVVIGLAFVARGYEPVGGLAAAAATFFDLRAFVLLPGLIVVAWAMRGRRRAARMAIVASILGALWAAAVLINPTLRYSLIELNAATRGGFAAWRPGSQIYAAFRGLLVPIGAIALLTHLGLPGAPGPGDRTAALGRRLLMGGGILAALTSLQPFDKYWSLVVPGLAVFAISRTPKAIGATDALRAWAIGLLVIGVALSGAYAATTNLDQAPIVARYEQAARELDTALPPGATFVRFDTQPFLGTFLPERDRTPAAVLDFLIADTSRRAQNERRVDEAIRNAAAIVDDGGLAVTENAVLPAYRSLWRVFASHLREFPCVRRVDGLAFRYRSDTCPAPPQG